MTRRWHVVAWLAGAVAMVAFIASCVIAVAGHHGITLFDDAMISMRYARNLVDSGSLGWNPGEHGVEGYTNFLWTLWMAVVHVAPLPDRWMSLPVIASAAALLVVAGRQADLIGRQLGVSIGSRAIALAATVCCYGLLYWSLRGMEVALLAALVTWGTLLIVRGCVVAAAACAVGLVLTRSDAIVFVVVWIGFVAFTLRGAPRWRALGVLVGTTAVAIGAHTVFRWAYYGDVLPNTFYLKLGGIPLGVRLTRGTAALWHVLQSGWIVPVAVAAAAFTRREHRAVMLLLAGIVASAAAYSVYVGGDAWEQFDIPNRYLAPALPALFVLAALGLDAIVASPRASQVVAAGLVAFALFQLVMPFAPWRIHGSVLGASTVAVRVGAGLACALALVRWPRRWIVAVALLLSTSAERWVDWAEHGAADVAIDADRVRHGLAIRAATSDDATLATTPAGNIPYFARRRTIDLLGKSDTRIAHEPPKTSRFHPGHVKWDYPYSIGELRPDLVDELFTPAEASLVDADKRAMPGWGYTYIGSNIYLRVDSTRVDRDKLLRELAR